MEAAGRADVTYDLARASVVNVIPTASEETRIQCEDERDVTRPYWTHVTASHSSRASELNAQRAAPWPRSMHQDDDMALENSAINRARKLLGAGRDCGCCCYAATDDDDDDDDDDDAWRNAELRAAVAVDCIRYQ